MVITQLLLRTFKKKESYLSSLLVLYFTYSRAENRVSEDFTNLKYVSITLIEKLGQSFILGDSTQLLLRYSTKKRELL